MSNICNYVKYLSSIIQKNFYTMNWLATFKNWGATTFLGWGGVELREKGIQGSEGESWAAGANHRKEAFCHILQL